MPLDYEGTTNEFKERQSVISPELQSIIDKVSGMSVSPGRKIQALTTLGGMVGGLEERRRTEAGQMARLGITGEQEMAKTKLTEAGALQRTNITTAPAIAEQKRKNQLFGSLTFGGVGLTGTAGTGGLWYDMFKDNPITF
jgi:hypothetical protein